MLDYLWNKIICVHVLFLITNWMTTQVRESLFYTSSALVFTSVNFAWLLWLIRYSCLYLIFNESLFHIDQGWQDYFAQGPNKKDKNCTGPHIKLFKLKRDLLRVFFTKLCPKCPKQYLQEPQKCLAGRMRPFLI